MRKLTIQEMNRLTVDAFKQATKIPVVLILDNIRSALNVGSAFRTADAFRLEGIALCGITAQPPHREILKTAIGATQSVDWAYFKSTEQAIQHYQERGFRVAAVEQAQNSTPLQEFKVENGQSVAVVFGNEVQGVSQAAMDLIKESIEIPQWGTKHSLNVSVCLGIVAWELVKQQPFTNS
ncbi:MAG: RNA methyltransferase [Aureispira sp.]|nr:RNA methyltransferase [Aureispira sp.]